MQSAIAAIRKAKPRSIVVFTGAGISADSGIPTFRGDGGLWRNYRAEDLATPEAFARNPQLVLEWYEMRREIVRNAKPNAAHVAIAKLQDALVVTQNVDGLHTRAGSQNLIELHGNIFRTRTVNGVLRPDVVWFGEMLPEGAFERAAEAVSNCDLLLVIGTSGVVYPAAGLVGLARRLSIEINPQASTACTFAIEARAAEATPPIVDAILEA